MLINGVRDTLKSNQLNEIDFFCDTHLLYK